MNFRHNFRAAKVKAETDWAFYSGNSWQGQLGRIDFRWRPKQQVVGGPLAGVLA